MSREQSQYVLEIRYQPNAKVLDHRGKWAELIAAEMHLPHWVIVENRVDVFDDAQNIRCYVGFRNMGYIITKPPTTNFFSDQSVKFLKFVGAFDDFETPLRVQRIGVRTRMLTPFDGGMEALVSMYKDRFLGPTPKAEAVLGGNLIDIGGALNFSGKFGNFNTNGGPMPAEQAKSFFPDGEDHPEVGLYFDVDYWMRPQQAMLVADIAKVIRQFSSESLAKHANIKDLIIGELPDVQEAWEIGRAHV